MPRAALKETPSEFRQATSVALRITCDNHAEDLLDQVGSSVNEAGTEGPERV